jgi:RNase adaptor protein for sRNA GlmZ degradation
MTGELIHATTVARHGAAVLLRGASGAGKSDLALRLIDRGWSLVSDDQSELRVEEGALVVDAPASIKGSLEVRGLGIRALPRAGPLPLRLVVDLKPGEEIERLPGARDEEIAGRRFPVISCDPFEVSTPIKLEMVLTDVLRARSGESDVLGEGRAKDDGERSADDEGAANSIVLVSGLSGAGRSTTLKILEDVGYEAIDNLPLDMLSDLIVRGGVDRDLAVGLDIRTRNFAARPFLEQLDRLEQVLVPKPTLLFIDCSDEVVVRRFMETRRRHPLAADGRPIGDGIAAERRLIEPLRDRASLVVDTSSLTPSHLRQVLAARLGFDERSGMLTFITSFSYREGIPRNADFVLDVRFLANPHYEPDLRGLSGKDEKVVRFVEHDPSFAPFMDRIAEMLAWLMDLFERQGKSYLTVAIGCTGGRHRSVAVAENYAQRLQEAGRKVTVVHRDIENDPRRRDGLKMSDALPGNSG